LHSAGIEVRSEERSRTWTSCRSVCVEEGCAFRRGESEQAQGSGSIKRQARKATDDGCRPEGRQASFDPPGIEPPLGWPRDVAQVVFVSSSGVYHHEGRPETPDA